MRVGRWVGGRVGAPVGTWEMRYFLLGAEGSAGTVALSSEKKSKVSAHGQGGVGKTTMAAAVVRDVAVRSGFDRIGWVPVGPTTAVPLLQVACAEENERLFAQCRRFVAKSISLNNNG